MEGHEEIGKHRLKALMLALSEEKGHEEGEPSVREQWRLARYIKQEAELLAGAIAEGDPRNEVWTFIGRLTTRIEQALQARGFRYEITMVPIAEVDEGD